MDTQFIKDKKLTLLVFILFLIATIIICKLEFTIRQNNVSYGDIIGLFTYREKGQGINSAIAIYDPNFKHEKISFTLDEEFTDIDQIEQKQNLINKEIAVFNAYNTDTNLSERITIELATQRIREDGIVQSEYEPNLAPEIESLPQDKVKLSKNEENMTINDPNLVIDGKSYSIVDYETISNEAV